MSESDDKWSLLSAEYWKKFEAAFNNLTLEYDEDDSGTIVGEDEETHSSGEIRIGRC